MNITVDVTEEAAGELFITLLAQESEIKDLLEQTQRNIRAIEAALNPVEHQIIGSSSGLQTYDVTKTLIAGYPTGAGVNYECSCPSFQYQKGLDDHSRCKHIREAVSNPFNWTK